MCSTEYDPNWGKPAATEVSWIITITMVVKSVIFGLPPLIVGVLYQSKCQIQEWIPRFLIVLGAEMFIENFSMIIAFCILMAVLRKQSEVKRQKAA